MSRHHILLAATAAAALTIASGAGAQSLTFNTPHTTTAAGATSVSLNGSTFVNQGLVGVGRLPATLHDFNGETLGSFSGMAFDLSTWRRNGDGSYGATLYTLPDRGPNNVGGLTTTNYAARLNKFSIVLNPYTGAASLAPTQTQLQLTQSGGFLLRDTTGALFTGRDPQAGTLTRDGIIYPVPPAGDIGAGKISIDAEAVTFLHDGSFYVGDEYGAAVYYFDKTGKQIGAIQAPPSVLPLVNGVVNFNGVNDAPLIAGSTGRRSNQGMEGVSVSPDGKRLFAVLQSAALQDNPTNVNQRRNNTRVFVYDISATRTPTAPIAEYVLQLPAIQTTGAGGALNAVGAQSEILALNNTQFLVLSRDGNGRGVGNTRPAVFKSVLLVDVAGATNLTGTAYAGTTPISTTADASGTGALVPGITPVKQVELVNLLNPVQLGKFGLNITNNPTTQYSLSEKWEAMGLVPVLEEGKPQDFFLLIGNDNDFISSDVDAAGVTNANTSLTDPASGTGDNDNVILVYRLTLPTYIDPQAFSAMEITSPIALLNTRIAAVDLGGVSGAASMQALDQVRRARMAGVTVAGARVWGQAAIRRVGTPQPGLSVDGGSLSVGAEAGTETGRLGATLSSQDYDGGGSGFKLEGQSVSGSLYGSLVNEGGFYGMFAATYGRIEFDRIDRPASYGLTATGATEGKVVSLEGEIGWSTKIDGFVVGPYAGLRHAVVDLDGYVEHGAAVGNVAMPDQSYSRFETTLGVDAAYPMTWGTPSLRVGYTTVNEGGDTTANVALASNLAAVSTVALPAYDDGFASATLAIDGHTAAFFWRAAIQARFTEEETSSQLTVGLSKQF